MKIANPLVGFALAALFTAAPVLSASFGEDSQNASIGTLLIQNAFTRPTLGGATTASGYMAITNEGSAPDRLVAVTSDFSKKVEIHESKSVNGVEQMHEITDGVAIAPGQTVDLKPGGIHVMFLDISQPVKPGDIIRATLSFENAGQIGIAFKAASSPGATKAPQ